MLYFDKIHCLALLSCLVLHWQATTTKKWEAAEEVPDSCNLSSLPHSRLISPCFSTSFLECVIFDSPVILSVVFSSHFSYIIVFSTFIVILIHTVRFVISGYCRIACYNIYSAAFSCSLCITPLSMHCTIRSPLPIHAGLSFLSLMCFHLLI